MTLRTRAITLIAVTVLGGVVLFALAAFAVVRAGYRELGQSAAEDRIDQVAGAINGELVRLRRAADPLASSVNAVAFAQGQPDGQSFLMRVGPSALDRYDIDALVVLDAMGGVVHAVAAEDSPPALLDVARNPVLRIPQPVSRTAEGVVIGEAGPAIALARAITGPLSAQVPAGTLVFLRDLTDRTVSRDALGLEGVSFTARSDRAFVEAPLAPNEQLLHADGSASATYTDPVGRTVLVVDASVPATIREAESDTLRQLVLLSVALAAGVGLTLLIWFERRLLSRLARLTGLVSASTSADRPEVELRGDDELSGLANRIEGTLLSLEATEHELRATNAQLEEAAEVKNQFISVVSHELRTPLTSILGFTETLRTRLDEIPHERVQYFLDRMSVQANNLDRMVEELLVLSRMSSGRMRHEPERIVLIELVEEVVRSLPPGPAISVEPGTNGAEVVVDPDHLRRILTNYLENARKYGESPIEVRTEVADGTVSIRVRDHGPGVPEEFVDQLFEPFTQASRGTTRTSRGVGLGLSIVSSLAETNAGRAWYEAGRPGAVFGVSFPLADRRGRGKKAADATGQTGPSTLTPAS